MMNTLQVVLFFYVIHTVSSDGITNLLGFYGGFRKLCLCRCGISSRHFDYMPYGSLINTDIYSSYYMPWLAKINIGSITMRGSLISDRHVITAANPLYRKPASEVTVTLGANGLCSEGGHSLNTSVEAVLIHPGYSPTLTNNDIALLRLRNPVQFSEFISPICMPLYDLVQFEQLAWTASWTKSDSESCITKISTLPILSHRNCFESNSSIALSDKSCLGPLGSKSIICENDVGGPVMTRLVPGSPFRLVGVITNASCEEETSPLFIRTIDHLLWIHEHIRRDCQCF